MKQNVFGTSLSKPVIWAMGGALATIAALLLLTNTAKGSPPPAADQQEKILAKLDQNSSLLSAQQAAIEQLKSKSPSSYEQANQIQESLEALHALVEDLNSTIGQSRSAPDATKNIAYQLAFMQTRMDRVESLLKVLDAKLSTPQTVHQLLTKQTALAAQKPN
jgi:DNA repair exonuclease SbcCD ATPase subunit